MESGPSIRLGGANLRSDDQLDTALLVEGHFWIEVVQQLVVVPAPVALAMDYAGLSKTLA